MIQNIEVPKAAIRSGRRPIHPTIRTVDTTAPAPRFKCPTSELPIWPSGSPTARPHAMSSVCGFADHSSSNTGVDASVTALPGPAGCAGAAVAL